MSISRIIESIEREMFNSATKRNCGNCKYFSREEGVCKNAESGNMNDFVDDDIFCLYHEFKEEHK